MTLNKPLKATVSAALLGAALSLPAAAAMEVPTKPVNLAQFIEDVGGAERINFSGKLRMLSQRIPAAACNLTAGVDVEKSESVLKSATAEFEKIIQALELGDETLGIKGGEDRRKTLAAIAEVHKEWDIVKKDAEVMLASGATDALNQDIADHNMKLLGAAKLLVSELSGQYSDPTAIIQSDAIRIDIAGRQRMLTQKMSKEACYILSGVNVEASKKAIGGTANMFDASLNALMNGMPEAGIQASDDPQIAAGLVKVAAGWSFLKGHLSELDAGTEWDMETRAQVFNTFNSTMAEMNKVVGMYAEASKLGL